jgi:hypothetical protein
MFSYFSVFFNVMHMILLYAEHGISVRELNTGQNLALA